MSLVHVKGVDTDDLGNKQSEDTFDCYINPTEIKAIVVKDDIGHIAFIHGGDMAVGHESVDRLVVATQKGNN